MATIIRTDGTTEELNDLSLKALQGAVGGLIQIIPTNDGREMVLNEEGKVDGLPFNPIATALTRGVVADDDYIMGDVVICKTGEMS